MNYPKTRVLSVQSGNSRQEDKSSDVYADYHASQRAGVSGIDYTDDRLPNKLLVIGVQVGDTYRAYPLTLFTETSLINDEVDGVPLLIFHDKDSFATAVFARTVGDTVLTFKVKKDARAETALAAMDNRGYFARDNSGTQWNLITGKATAGERKLMRLPAVNIYWFAWARYHPETSIYR